MSRMCFNCMQVTEDGDFCAFCGKKLKAAPAHHLLPGTVLNGKYTVGYALGEGGFGVTYIGLDNSLQIKVAIKEFFPKGIVGRNSAVSSDVSCLNASESDKLFDAEKAKVINEARILAKFSKERGIVNVREYFEANNTAYIVMEYLEGETLEEYLAHSGPLSADQAFAFLLPVMNVLGKLHKEGVVHRDISPDNLMFDGDQIKLLDFGAAREVLYSTSKSFSVILKHGYAPEEQYRRKGHQGPWTDVYALCATLYYCITNVAPDTSLDRMHEDELKCPSDLGVSISEEQENALMRGLSVLPEDRLQTVSEFIAAWNGEVVPVANTRKETIAVLQNENSGSAQEKTNKATAGNETVYGGNAGFVSVDSDERNVAGNYNPAGASPTSNTKPKKNATLIVVLCSVIAVLLVGAIVLIGLIMSKDDNGNQGNQPGTTQTTGESSNTTTSTQDTTSTQETTVPVVDKYQVYLDNADQFVAENKFDEAIAELNTAEQLYGAHNKVTTKRKEVVKAKGLYALSQYESASDYKSAIKHIDESMSDYASDADIVSKKNLYISKYRSQVLDQAASAFETSGYEKAIEVLNSSVDVLPDDPDINSALAKYSEYAPISIADLEYFSGHDFGVGNNIKDNLGNIHNNVVYPVCQGWSNASTANVYKINKKYSTLTGLWFQKYDCRTASAGYPNEGDLEIYGDGKLLYSGVMKPGLEPIELNIDISGVSDLKIVYWGGGTTGSYSGIANFSVQK